MKKTTKLQQRFSKKQGFCGIAVKKKIKIKYKPWLSEVLLFAKPQNVVCKLKQHLAKDVLLKTNKVKWIQQVEI